MLADSPVVDYAVSKTNGQLEAVGDAYDTAPYGIAVPKGDGNYAKAIQGAVQALITDGTYKSITRQVERLVGRDHHVEDQRSGGLTRDGRRTDRSRARTADQGGAGPAPGPLGRGRRDRRAGRDAGPLVPDEPELPVGRRRPVPVLRTGAARAAQHADPHRAVDGDRDRRRGAARGDAAVPQPGARGRGGGLHLAVPRHPADHPADLLELPRGALPAPGSRHPVRTDVRLGGHQRRHLGVRRVPARAGAQRGRVHGGDRARRHPVGRPGAERGGGGAGVVPHADAAADRAAAGDAGDRAAHRQRDHLDAQDDFARGRHRVLRADGRRADHLLAHVPDDPAAHRRGIVVPGLDVGALGRADVHRAPVRAWIRRGRPLMTPMVQAEDVHKSFGSTEVLCGVDMVVQPGEVACVIGPSGSGKSTFLRCVNHLERINAGTMRVDGELIGYREANGKLYELRESEIARQRRHIGMVFQRFHLFPHMTARRTSWRGRGRCAGSPAARAESRRRRCWIGWGSPTSGTPIPTSSPAASSSGWRSRGRWRWSRGSCCSTSRPRRSTPSWSARCST